MLRGQPEKGWEVFDNTYSLLSSKMTCGILTTKVRKLPFLGVNDYFLGKCSLIVGEDKFWVKSAHFLGVNYHY